MKYSIFFVVFLLFSSCSIIPSSNTPNNERGLGEIQKDNFSIEIPQNWTESSAGKNITPSSGNIALSYESKGSSQGIKNNILILESEKKIAESSETLLTSTKEILQANMTSFTPIKDEIFQFADGESGKILMFQGRYNSQTPELVYLQTARNCGDKNYFITIAIGEARSEYAAYEYILQSFSCK